MAISDDDRYLALGEKGDNPSVLVFDVETGVQLGNKPSAEFQVWTNIA